jgi:hypothetical protein
MVKATMMAASMMSSMASASACLRLWSTPSRVLIFMISVDSL